MARLSWLPFAFFLILALGFAIQTANAGKEGSLRLEGKMPCNLSQTPFAIFLPCFLTKLIIKSVIVQTVPRPAMVGVRKHITGSHVCSSATIAARVVCAFPPERMATGRNVHATTASKPRKARINVHECVENASEVFHLAALGFCS
ncbi:hypothetical protein SCA6_016493 [Theobroma cacao]